MEVLIGTSPINSVSSFATFEYRRVRLFITNTESARMLRQTQTEALPFSETFPPGFTPGSQLSKNGRSVKSCLRKNRMVHEHQWWNPSGWWFGSWNMTFIVELIFFRGETTKPPIRWWTPCYFFAFLCHYVSYCRSFNHWVSDLLVWFGRSEKDWHEQTDW